MAVRLPAGDRYTQRMSEPSPRDRDDVDLRAFLADRDVACPLCGYNLRGLTSDGCPECGQRLTLSVALAEPRQRAFIAGVVGISLSLGFCAMLLAWVVLMLVRRGARSGPNLIEILPVVLGTVVASILLWGWIKFRPRLMRMDGDARWACAGLATIVSMGCPIWFMATVR